VSCSNVVGVVALLKWRLAAVAKEDDEDEEKGDSEVEE
jgi:hypothetical protein